MLALTASASRGLPSWNVRSGRIVTVHTVASSFGVTDSARYGTHSASGVAAVSEP